MLKSEAEAARIEARSNLHRLEEELRNTRISRAAAQVDLEKVQRALREAEEALHAERSTSAIDSAVTHTMVVSDRASGFTGSTRSRQRPWRISSSSSSVSMSLTGTPRGSGPTEDTTPGWYSSSSETWRTKSKGTTNRPGLKPSAVPLLQIPSGNDQGNYKAESVRSDFSIPWLPVQVSTTRRSPVSAPDRLAAGTPKPAGSGSESVNSTENMPVERSRSSSFPGNARDRKTWEVPSLLGGTVHIQTRTDSQR